MKKKALLLSLSALGAGIGCFILLQRGPGHPPTREAEERPGGPSGALQALEDWTRARAYPDRDIPAMAYAREYRRMKTATKEYNARSQAFNGWQPIGPVNLQGRSISVAINPLNPNTVYCGTASGGLWRSRTGGLGGDWQRIPTGSPVLGVSAVVIDPADSNSVYIGTGEVYRYQGAYGGLVIRTTRGSYGIGILKTTDGGQTWHQSYQWPYDAQEGVQAMKMNPLNHNTLYAATTEGVLKTTDAGATWTLVLPMPMGEDILIHRIDTNKVIASCGNFGYASSVVLSDDGGVNWYTLPLPAFSGKTLLESYYANPDRIYASLADSTTGTGGLYLSLDFGANWTLLNGDAIYQVQGWYSHFVAVHPFDSSQVVHAAVNIYKSTDGGSNFAYSTGSYADHHSYAYVPSQPNILYIVNDAGIFRSSNFGASFANVGFGMQTGQFYNGFSNSSTDSLLAIGQVQDEIPGYIYHGSLVWGRSAADESGWTAIDQTNDHIMYAADRFGGDIYKSTDRGASFGWTGGFGGAGAWNSPFVVSSSNPSVLYFGHSIVYKSTTGGAAWSPTNSGAVLDGNPPLSMAVSRTNPDTLYVGTAPYASRAHIFRSTSGGAAWTDITGALPDRYPLDLAVNPSNSRTVYAAFGGFGSGHLFKSLDAGTTWADISASLPDVPATAVVVDPADTNHVFAGNDLGVFVSTDGGSSWLAFNDGLTDAVLVSDLSISPSNRMLRLTTHGNGLFERRLPVARMLSLSAPHAGDIWQAGKTKAITWDENFITTVRIDYSTDGGAGWKPLAANIPAYRGRYDWTPPLISISQAMVRVVAEDDTTFRSQTAGFFRIDFGGGYVSVDRGWNIISIPLAVADGRRSMLFPDASSNAIAYEGAYAARETLAAGPGYWIKFASAGAIPLLGDSLSADTVSVQAGWSMIGSLSTPLPAAAVSSDPPGILTSNFYGFKGGYAAAETLLPGKGYWVKTTAGGRLILRAAAGRSLSEPEAEAASRLSRIIITDGSGSSQTLYFSTATDQTTLARSELPPSPPFQAFDARFSSGRMAEVASPSHPERIQLRSALFPVTIRWEIVETECGYRLEDGKTLGVELAPARGALVIDDPSVTSLTLRAAMQPTPAKPALTSLEQNYPNPFNPATTIRYSLSKPGHVRLRLYDIAGRITATIVDGRQSAGQHSASLNLEGKPSGIYFYELRTEGYFKVRKMTLIR